MPAGPTLVWLRNDLRLADNPALAAATAKGPLIPVYVLDDAAPGAWRLGGAARWWLHHALASLSRDLAAHGQRLLLRRGDAAAELDGLVRSTGAGAVFWNRRYEPWGIAQDRAIKAELRAGHIDARSFNGSLMREPWELTQGVDRAYDRFAHFAAAFVEAGPPPAPLPIPTFLPNPSSLASLDLAALDLLPRKPDWASGLRATWQPGEAGAGVALATFLVDPIQRYGTERHLPGRPGATSRLSPHLRFGTISPRQVWHAAAATSAPISRDRLPAFLRQLVWREHAHHLLYHYPDLLERSLRPELERLPWANDPTAFAAWCHGRTGYPIVDAGMRELWRTGFMHNRVRMIAGSFLTRHLLLPWQRGEAWFWDTLCDADPANNALGWQWVAGGADPVRRPRILNPVRQGEKFDPEGAYVRRWLPELAKLPDAFVHRPFAAPRAVLAYTGLRLGEDYPLPIVDHDAARERALAALGPLT